MIRTAMGRRSTGTQYMLLANNLLERIGAGEYPPGALLPSEMELCEQFSVSRITVRSALKELEMRGLVSRRPGIGTRVERPQAQESFSLGGNVDEVLRFTKGVPLKVLRAAELPVSAALAEQLDLPKGQRVLHLETLRQLPGCKPLVYGNHYVPVLLAPAPAAVEGVDVSLAQWLADRLGDEVLTIQQQISAITLKKAEAAHLGEKPGAPALKSTRWYFGKDGRLLLASVGLFPGVDYIFKSTLRRNVS